MNNISVIIAIAVIVTGLALYVYTNDKVVIPSSSITMPIYLKKSSGTTLYVYESVGTSSRKWSSFYDRRHKEPRSAYLTLCDNTHVTNHTIGDIVPVNDEMLVKLVPERKISPESLQYNRLLRDLLLLKLVCRNGGIVCPRHTIFMKDTEYLVQQTNDPKTIFVYGSGNDEYGCPIFASYGGCETEITELIEQQGEMWFKGGTEFKGGAIELLSNTNKLDTKLLSGVAEIGLHDLTQELKYDEKHIAIRIPFTQHSGSSGTARTHEWIYSVSFDELIESPSLFRNLVVIGSKGKLMCLEDK